MEFEKRFCAFIDILGFKEKKKKITIKIILEAIMVLLNTIKKYGKQ